MIDAVRASNPANGGPEVALGLRGSRTGVDSVWLLHADPGGPQADSLTSLVSRARWRVRKSEFAGVRLRITTTPTIALRIERSELCPPVSTSAAPVTATVRISVPAGSPPPGVGSAVIRHRIAADGRVLGVSVVTGTGNPDLDAAIRRSAQQSRYQPALLDGRPVEVWLQDNRAEVVRP